MRSSLINNALFCRTVSTGGASEGITECVLTVRTVWRPAEYAITGNDELKINTSSILF